MRNYNLIAVRGHARHFAHLDNFIETCFVDEHNEMKLRFNH